LCRNAFKSFCVPIRAPLRDRVGMMYCGTVLKAEIQGQLDNGSRTGMTI
jgi:hypothetical protein